MDTTTDTVMDTAMGMAMDTMMMVQSQVNVKNRSLINKIIYGNY